MENRLHYLISMSFLKLNSNRFKAMGKKSLIWKKSSSELTTGSLDLYANYHHLCFPCKAVHVCIIVLSEHTEFIKISCAIITTRTDFQGEAAQGQESKGVLRGGKDVPCQLQYKTYGYDAVPRKLKKGAYWCLLQDH